MYTKEHCELLKQHAGEPWRPSNGFEGDIFMSKVCGSCRHSDDDLPGCKISMDAFCFDIGEEGYPKEWVIGEDGTPQCTAYDPAGNSTGSRDESQT